MPAPAPVRVPAAPAVSQDRPLPVGDVPSASWWGGEPVPNPSGQLAAAARVARPTLLQGCVTALEVSLGTVPRHIVCPQPGRGEPGTSGCWRAASSVHLEVLLSTPPAGETPRGVISRFQKERHVLSQRGGWGDPSAWHQQGTKSSHRWEGETEAGSGHHRWEGGLVGVSKPTSCPSAHCRCSVGSAPTRSCLLSPTAPSASPQRHPPRTQGASTPSPASSGSGTSRSSRSWVMAPLVLCVVESGARLLARR